jgi:hypothetical protein
MRRIFLLFLLLASCAQRDEIVELKDGWEMQRGQAVGAVTGWQKIQVPYHEFDDPYRGWTTFRVKMPALRGPIALEGGWVSDVTRWYAGDMDIGGKGSADPYTPGAYQFFIRILPALAEQAPYLHLTIYNPGDYPVQLSDVPVIGPADAVMQNFYVRETISFMLLAAYLVVGGYHILLGIKRSREPYNTFFGLFCILVSAYWFFRVGSRDLVFGDHVLLRTRIEYSILFLIGPLLLTFLSQFFNQKYDRVAIGAFVVYGVFVLLTWTNGYPMAARLLSYWQLSALPLIVYLVFYIIREAVRKKPDAMSLIAGVLLLMAGAVHDIFAARGDLPTPHIARYTFLAFILGIAAVLANRFVRVHNQVEELNRGLEKKVEERTRQLQATLSQVQELKVQQDGDYFLTSLLIQPLSANSVESRSVSVSILVRQKKTFQFRQWQAEIGGDLATAASILLRNKRYTVFINGDAMGKSIQGAGGALVLGTVFKSLIARTEQSPLARNRHPEQWLKDCFVELQNVFVSFEGTMMLSAIIGLIEDETGMMYFLNAEHPWLVLFRDGKAEFMEHELFLRKIGIAGLEGKIRIETFRLQPDDVVFVGSDGRDDIAIGVDSAGKRVINEDETLFLRNVEAGRGIPEEIERAIRERGEVTDDLTLMRIAYREDAPARAAIAEPEGLSRVRSLVAEREFVQVRSECEKLLISHPDHPQILGSLGIALLALKEFKAAVPILERYVDLCPWDAEFLYFTARAMKRIGAYQSAADYGERMRLRNREHLKNLLNLADIYRLSRNYARAAALVDEARVLPGSEEFVRKLEVHLKASAEPAVHG